MKKQKHLGGLSDEEITTWRKMCHDKNTVMFSYKHYV